MRDPPSTRIVHYAAPRIPHARPILQGSFVSQLQTSRRPPPAVKDLALLCHFKRGEDCNGSFPSPLTLLALVIALLVLLNRLSIQRVALVVHAALSARVKRSERLVVSIATR
jgi:hypothetical protein